MTINFFTSNYLLQFNIHSYHTCVCVFFSLQKWELFVLSRLGWDLSCVTPLDFLELLLIRLPIRSADYPDLDVDKVRQHAQAFISLAAKGTFVFSHSSRSFVHPTVCRLLLLLPAT